MKGSAKRIFSIACIVLVSVNQARAQGESTDAIVNYIKTYAALAISEMHRTGFPASIKIAQGIIETSAGRGELVNRSNNHFGLKCKSSWTGKKVYHDDDEQGECFRQYENAEASFKDHSDYLKSQPRYASLFEKDPDDYNAWSWGLKNAGYATNPVYAQSLIRYVEAYSLNELNNIGRKKNSDELEAYFSSISNRTIVLAANNGVSENTVKTGLSTEGKKRDKHHGRKTKLLQSKHIVKKGDSLFAIAKKYRISVEAIKKANRLKKDELQVGQILKLPKHAS